MQLHTKLCGTGEDGHIQCGGDREEEEENCQLTVFDGAQIVVSL